MRFGFFKLSQFLGSDARSTSRLTKQLCRVSLQGATVEYKGKNKWTVRCHETQWLDTQRDYSSEAKPLLPQAQSKTEPLKSVGMTGCNCNLYWKYVLTQITPLLYLLHYHITSFMKFWSPLIHFFTSWWINKRLFVKTQGIFPSCSVI